MEDIKKAIEEEYLEYLHGTTDEKEFLNNNDLLPFKDAVKACEITASFVLSKWEESTRWRKVEEELPKIEKVWIRCVIHLPNNKTHVEYSSGVIYSKTDYKLDNKLIASLMIPSCKVEIEWKPIH